MLMAAAARRSVLVHTHRRYWERRKESAEAAKVIYSFGASFSGLFVLCDQWTWGLPALAFAAMARESHVYMEQAEVACSMFASADAERLDDAELERLFERYPLPAPLPPARTRLAALVQTARPRK